MANLKGVFMFLEPQPIIQMSDAEKFVRSTDQKAKAILAQMAHGHRLMFLEFWKNPQAYCDFLGNKAYKFFESSRETQAYLAKWLPNYQVMNFPEGKDAIINEDGTITIVDVEIPNGE